MTMTMMMRIPHTGVLIVAAALLAAAAGSLEGLAVSATTVSATATTQRVLKSGKNDPPPPPPPPKSKTAKSSKKNPSRPTPVPAPAPTPAPTPEQCRKEGQTCVDCPNFCCTEYKQVYPFPNTFPNYYENYVTGCSGESGTCEFEPPTIVCGEYEVQCDETILALGVPCAPTGCVECTDVLVDGGVNCIPNPAGISTSVAMYFTVETLPLDRSGVASEHTTLFVPRWEGNLANKVVVATDIVCFVGGANGLAPNIASVHGGGGTDCSAKNGCGVHVHSGTSCDTVETQGTGTMFCLVLIWFPFHPPSFFSDFTLFFFLFPSCCHSFQIIGGHWYNTETLPWLDPWKLIGYKETNAEGDGQYAACVRTGFYDLMRDPKQLAGKVFILHAEDGSRVSCGVIQLGYPDQLVELETTLDVIPSPDDELDTYNILRSRAGLDELPGGEVTVLQNLAGLAVADGVCYLGFAKGLEPNVVSYLYDPNPYISSQQCNVTNGCGTHIHSGTGCADVESQGGHYYDSATLPVDPWQRESYYTTDIIGTAALIGCTITGTAATDYSTKPFIVHMPDGGRKLCGVLEGGDDPSPTPSPVPPASVNYFNVLTQPLDEMNNPTQFSVTNLFVISNVDNFVDIFPPINVISNVDYIAEGRSVPDAPATGYPMPTDIVCFVGGANGLAPNIASTHGGGGADCSAKNGCGVHIHSGTSCDTLETQGT